MEMVPATKDFGVTHGLDFARWITEIANLLKSADVSDPSVQVAFLEIAKSLERLRRYKKDLILGTYKNWLTVNEEVVTSFPTAEIVAAPMVRLMDAAGLWSIGVDHRIDIANVEMLATMLAHPEELRPMPESMKYLTLNPVKYIVVFAGEQQVEPEVGMPTPAEGSSASGVDKELFHQEADVLGALDDAFEGWGGEKSDPLKVASREMARKIEQVLPSLEKLASLDKKAPGEFLKGFFERDFGDLTRGKSADEFLIALGHVLRALPPEVQEKIFAKSFKKADRDESVDALRSTSADFRTNFMLERMLPATATKDLRDLSSLIVAPGGEVQMVEQIAKRLLAQDLSPEDRAKMQRMLGVFGFDPGKSVRRRIVLFIGKPGTDYNNINKLLTKRGYGVFLWDGAEAPGEGGQEMEPDIAILDAPMAGASGLGYLQKLAAASKKTAIIVFNDGAADMTAFYDLGVNRTTVLQKPVPSDILLSFFEDRKHASHAPAVPGHTSAAPQLRDNTSKYMKADLARAREIQERLIPKEIPEVNGAEIAMAYRPCNEVGGDYLDLFWVAPGKLAFVIADVSGKGVAAAMVMVMVRSVFRSVAAGAPTARETMIQVNRMLARDVKKGIFVSALYGIFDVDTQRVIVANGGHNPPVLYRHSAGTGEYQTLPGMALGLTERSSFDASIVETVYDLKPGDKLFTYTDGVTEAFALDGDMYGEDRLLETFNKQANNPAKAVLDAVMLDIDKFVGKAPRSDDTTMLVIGRPVTSPPARTLIDVMQG